MKRRTPDHPKIIDLEQRLSVTRYAAVGLLELLWHYAAEFAPQGNVGKYTDKAIAQACHWKKDAKAFVDSLVGSGWIDRDFEHRLVIHDWADHVDETTKKRLLRAKLEIIVRRKTAENGGQRQPESDPEDANGSLAGGKDGQGKDGQGKAEPSEDEKRFWIAQQILEFPGAKVLGKLPDEQIVSSLYDKVNGDMDALGRAFRALHLTGQKPTISWGWFLKVLPKYIKKTI